MRRLIYASVLAIVLLLITVQVEAATVTGTFRFHDELDPLNAPNRPIAFAKVEIWHLGIYFWNTWAHVGNATTDGNGAMSFTDTRGDGTYAVRVFATNYAVIVWPNDVLHTAPFYREPGQPGPVIYRQVLSVNDAVDFSYDFTDQWATQHFNIADAVRHGHDYASARRDPNETDPIPQANYQPTDVTIAPVTYYNPVLDEVVLSSTNVWEDYLLLHEYTHFLSAKISSFGFRIGISHNGCEATDILGNVVNEPWHAWMEGFADYFAHAVELYLPAGTLRGTSGAGTPGIDRLESSFEGFAGCSGTLPYSGDAIESYVASTLWDLLDRFSFIDPGSTDPGSINEAHDFMSRMDTAVFQIFDRELDIYGVWPTIWDFRNAWIARGLDNAGLDRILSRYHILQPPLPNQTAQLISQSVPALMQAGQPYNVSVTLRNTGVTTWLHGGTFKLGSQNPQDNLVWGISRVDLPIRTAPGEQVTFNFSVTAPFIPGTYDFQWRMIQESVEWFGDYTPNVSVNVYTVPDLIIQSISTNPVTPVYGQTIEVTVAVENQGNADAGSFYVDIYKDRMTAPATGEFGDQYCYISGLAAGAATTCISNISYVAAGMYSMWAQADTDLIVTESNEGNNVSGPHINDVTCPLVTYYRDNDGDGYGDPLMWAQVRCDYLINYVENNLDCNDNNDKEHPNQTWYQDSDSDGISNGNALTQCSRPAGYKILSELTAVSGDCNDNNASVYLDAPEMCDGLDNNCDGKVDNSPVIIKFDDVSSGTVINTHYSPQDVAFSCVACTSGSAFAIMTPFAASSPNVVSLHNWTSTFAGEEGAVKAQFTTPQGYVSIDARGVEALEILGAHQEKPFIQAFDSSGNYLETVYYPYEYGNPNWGTWQTLTISRAATDIKSVIFSSRNNLVEHPGGVSRMYGGIYGEFDNLRLAGENLTCPTTASAQSATGAGLVTYSSNAGSILNFTAVSEASLPTTGKPTGVTFPYGFFSLTLTSLSPGQTVTLTLIYPSDVPSPAGYWKVIGGVWTDVTSLTGDDDGDNILTLTISDGGLGDADGLVNGQISDPGGVAVVLYSDSQLSINKNGSGGGYVISDPAGIDCGNDCSEIYPHNRVVTLIATPDSSSIFIGWGGDPDCVDGVVTMDMDKTCTATFNNAAIAAGPIVNPANGHQYYLLNPNTWSGAEARAIALGGHLVTINDAAENAWVWLTFAPYGGGPLWIGLSDAAQEGTFVWASNEPATYFNWWCRAPGDCEPTNSSGVEHYVEMNNYVWNDNTNESMFRGVVEIDISVQMDLERLKQNSTLFYGLEFSNTDAVRFADFSLPIPPDVGEDNLTRAQWFLNDYRRLLRLDNPLKDLRFIRSSPDGFHLFFVQYHNDIPVFPAELGVHLDSTSITGLSGNYVPGIKVSPVPILSMGQAMELAVITGGEGTTRVGVTELWYINPGLLGREKQETHLAWRVPVETLNGHRIIFIDANSGTVVYIHSLDYEAFDLTLNTLQNTDPAGSSCYSSPGSSDVEWFDENGQRPNPNPLIDQEGINSYNNIRNVYNYWNQTLGRDSHNGNGGQIGIYIHVRMNWLNAQYVGGCNSFEFGDRLATLDITGHEFTHGVIHHEADLVYETQSGALNESYADIFAYFIDNTNWTMGEGSAIGILRTINDPPANGNPDAMQAALSGDGNGYHSLPAGDSPGNDNDWGFVHNNSGIPNKAASLIIGGGRYNGFSISGLGQQKAERLFYNVIANRLVNNSQFDDARNAAITEARNLYGPLSAEVCIVRNAYASVGLGMGDINCDGIEDTVPGTLDGDGDGFADVRDNCPVLQSPDLRDNDNDGVGNVCDNCSNFPNPDQINTDTDAYGDACDSDDDNDGLDDGVEINLGTDPLNPDTDGDGVGDNPDNCKLTSNPGTDWTDIEGLNHLNEQSDFDLDGIGDVCDNCSTVADSDNDCVVPPDDNCPAVYNPSQIDGDKDGVGDACDACQFDSRNLCVLIPQRFQDIFDKQIQISGLKECIGKGRLGSEIGACMFLDPRPGGITCPLELQMRDRCCPLNGMCAGPGVFLRYPDGISIIDIRSADLGFNDDDGFGIDGIIIPDRDGDMMPDVVIGAPLADPEGLLDAGSVVMISGANGKILNRIDGSAAGDQFGMSLSRLGDKGRFLVGAPGRNVFGNSDEGSIFLFEADGTMAKRFDWMLHGEAFGSVVSETPDVDGDGSPDFLVSAPGTARATSQGRVLLFSSNGEPIAEFVGDTAGDGFGLSISSAGDVNGDGRPDLLIGAPFSDPNGLVDAGSAFLYSSDGILIKRFDGAEAGAQFGASVAGGGDVDGDGSQDILAGAPMDDPGGVENAGSVFLYSGDGSLIVRLDGDSSDGHYGRSVYLGSDFNGDGLSDVMVEAPGVQTVDGVGTSTFFMSVSMSGDEDQDGYSNEEELLASSDLRNADSTPELTSIALYPGFNLVSIPAEMRYMDTAFKMIPVLGNEQGIGRVLHLNIASGRFEEASYEAGNILSGTDFQNGNGEGHIVYSKIEKVVTLTSKVCPIWNLIPGGNLIGTPCSGGTTAFQLLERLGGEAVVSSIQRFNQDTGEFETAAYHNGQPVGADFSIISGEGYFIYMRQDRFGFRP